MIVSTTSGKRQPQLTLFKAKVAEAARAGLPEISSVFDSLDEVEPEGIPCIVLSFDQGVRYDLLASGTYEVKAKLTVDIFVSRSLFSIQDCDLLSERLIQGVLSLPEATLEETSARNIDGEASIRALLHDFNVSLWWSPYNGEA